MPDLITHTASTYFISSFRKNDAYRIFFYLGIILPDIITRPIYIIWPSLYKYTVAMHTPVFLVFVVLLAGEFFRPSVRYTFYSNTFFGVFLHLLLDFFQKHLAKGYYWFFPFSWKSFEIGLFWPEIPLLLSPLWILFIIFCEWRLYSKRRIN